MYVIPTDAATVLTKILQCGKPFLLLRPTDCCGLLGFKAYCQLRVQEPPYENVPPSQDSIISSSTWEYILALVHAFDFEVNQRIICFIKS